MDIKTEKELAGFDIIKNSNISDTITYYISGSTMMYVNINTGAENKDFRKVIGENSYIYVDVMKSFIYKYGWLCKYFPEYKALLFVFYKFKDDDIRTFGWEEMFRFILWKEGTYAYSHGERKELDIYNLIDMEYAIDLCGQFIHADFSEPIGSNITITSGEEVRKYLNGPAWFLDRYITFHWRCDIFELLEDLISTAEKGKNSDMSYHVHYGICEHDMKGIEVSDFPIPEHICEIVEKYEKRRFDSYVKESCNNNFSMFCGFSICILENCSGEYVLRKFHAYICGNERNGKMPVKYIETERVHISDYVLKKCKLLDGSLAYFDRDGIDDGIFKYAVKYLEKVESQTIEYLSEVSSHYGGIYRHDFTIATACAIALIPFYEKFVNMLLTNEMERKKNNGMLSSDRNFTSSEGPRLTRFLSLPQRCMGSILNRLTFELGDISYNKTSLSQMLGISKAMLALFAEEENFSFEILYSIKKVFSDNKKYLLNINKEASERLFHFFLKNAGESKDSPYAFCLKTMISIFGTDNLFNFCAFLSRDEEKMDIMEYMQWLEDYGNYLYKLSVLKGNVSELIWKIKDTEELKRADSAITEAFMVLNDEKMYHEVSQDFKKQYDDWKKYEYCSDRFIITYPKGPTELIEEGIKLNHCAKEFINDVARGHTTILFIRKANCPNKPFFTLEVKKGEVRQCHGVNNCNMDSYEGLEDFVFSFVEKKGLSISENVNEALGN